MGELLYDLLVGAAAQCTAVAVGNGPLILSLFLAGLIGGVGHCAGMCGPFVLTQVAARLDAVPVADMREWRRLTGAALVPYHLGRGTIYTGLGAVSGALSGGLGAVAELRFLSSLLLGVAALAFLGYGLQRFGFGLGRIWSRADAGGGGWWSRLVGRWGRPLFARPTGLRGYVLGLLLGFIPCGLVYGALAASASAGEALAGAFAMAAFSAGTVPTLLVVGLAGHMAARRWEFVTTRLAPGLMVVNAGVLAIMAWTVLP